MSRDVHGMPSWVSLGSPDLQASKAFYRGLFRWESYTLTLAGFGDYEVFTEGAPGLGVAGVQTLADDTQFPSWTCFFMVDDVDACARTVAAAGGQDRVDPMHVAHLARVAEFADTQGAEFGVWQPGPSGETTLMGERSAACWVGLACRDVLEARRFYGEVFGWSDADVGGHGFAYTRWMVGDQMVAGAILMDDTWPAGYPSHWYPFFEVADCDTATAEAAGLGARVRVAPTDTGASRFSVMTDPTGARFGVIASYQPTRPAATTGR